MQLSPSSVPLRLCGSIYFHARYYNPAVGHFMQADSVVPNPSDTYSYDRYAYCRNNPINLTDPTGHNPLLAILAIAAIVAASTFAASIVSGASVGQAFQSAAIAFGSTFLFGPYAGAVVSAGLEASMHGGNVMRAMLIAGVSMGIGMGVGQAAGAAAAGMTAAGQGVMNVLASGIVGGAISSAMGGDFWQGFAGAAVAAGVSIAANEIAGEMEGHAEGSEGGGDDQSAVPNQARPTKPGASAVPNPKEFTENGQLQDLIPNPDTLSPSNRSIYLIAAAGQDGDVDYFRVACIAAGWDEKNIVVAGGITNGGKLISPVTTKVGLASALEGARGSFMTVVFAHSDGARVYFGSYKVAFSEYAKIMKTSFLQSAPKRLVLWHCNAEYLGQMVARTFVSSDVWTPVGRGWSNGDTDSGLGRW